MEFSCDKPIELDEIAVQLLQVHNDKRVFAFYGKMGAGKTTFIKNICNQLHVVDTAISPTFAIINEYLTEEGSSIYHFDFYRIKNLTEFLDLGCEEYFYSGLYCFIEWPEKIDDYLPEQCVPVFIEEVNGKRLIKF
jgi:tRNA threonylcarbamoyladenosine biosynthesis protein TsaE